MNIEFNRVFKGLGYRKKTGQSVYYYFQIAFVARQWFNCNATSSTSSFGLAKIPKREEKIQSRGTKSPQQAPGFTH